MSRAPDPRLHIRPEPDNGFLDAADRADNNGTPEGSTVGTGFFHATVRVLSIATQAVCVLLNSALMEYG